MPPETFFPMVDRFIKAYQKAEQDLEDWKLANVSWYTTGINTFIRMLRE